MLMLFLDSLKECYVGVEAWKVSVLCGTAETDCSSMSSPMFRSSRLSAWRLENVSIHVHSQSILQDCLTVSPQNLICSSNIVGGRCWNPHV